MLIIAFHDKIVNRNQPGILAAEFITRLISALASKYKSTSEAISVGLHSRYVSELDMFHFLCVTRLY